MPHPILIRLSPVWMVGLMILVGGLARPTLSPAAEGTGAEDTTPTSGYRLGVRDQVEVTIFEESDLGTSQFIDSEGQIRLGLIGTVMIAGQTIREAEKSIAAQYIEQRFLRQPMVTIRILEYAPREAMVNGAVLAPGPFTFPPEAAAVDIVEVITKRGGFQRVARDNAVRVTRFSENGRETFTVQVRDMLLGRTTNNFLILPGDVIYVDD